MGYEVHITRRNEWSDEGDDITIDEWKRYIEEDKDMRLDNFAEAKLQDGSILRTESDGLAVWVKYSKNTEQNKAWFSYHLGCIDVKNPDDEIIAKMVAISKMLNAKVQGDEGEFYPIQELKVEKTSKPWWKIW